MKNSDEIKQIAARVLFEEAHALEELADRIDDRFVDAVEAILFTTSHAEGTPPKGRVIVCGIGKSANIATKIVSTFNSTGTPALFLHAADAIHGDLGMIQKDDVIICISKSGNTPEIKVLVPLLKSFGNKLIALVGNMNSFLATQADIVLDATVRCEACPNNLAPTTSTTAQLSIGDALAVALIECRNFTAQDFARFHPGGALGKQLYMHVSDLYKDNERPAVTPQTPMRDVFLEMTSCRLGCTVVVSPENNKVIEGIICDGDLRRMLRSYQHYETLTASQIMTPHPKTILYSDYAVNALQVMRTNSITQLVVVDEDNYYLGVLHIHDILREGII